MIKLITSSILLVLFASCTKNYTAKINRTDTQLIDYKNRNIQKGDTVMVTGTVYDFGGIEWEVVNDNVYFPNDTTIYQSNKNGFYSNIQYKRVVIK